MYNDEGNKIDLVKCFAGLKEWEQKSIDCFYLHDGTLKPLRILATRKDSKAMARDLKRQKKEYSKEERAKISKDTKELNNYIILCTNLTYDTQNIFELYRCRWQVELVFKELKSVLSFGDVPSSNEDSIKAWFYGKLLVAALSLLLVNESHFSPKG